MSLRGHFTAGIITGHMSNSVFSQSKAGLVAAYLGVARSPESLDTSLHWVNSPSSSPWPSPQVVPQSVLSDIVPLANLTRDWLCFRHIQQCTIYTYLQPYSGTILGWYSYARSGCSDILLVQTWPNHTYIFIHMVGAFGPYGMWLESRDLVTWQRLVTMCYKEGLKVIHTNGGRSWSHIYRAMTANMPDMLLSLSCWLSLTKPTYTWQTVMWNSQCRSCPVVLEGRRDLGMSNSRSIETACWSVISEIHVYMIIIIFLHVVIVYWQVKFNVRFPACSQHSVTGDNSTASCCPLLMSVHQHLHVTGRQLVFV